MGIISGMLLAAVNLGVPTGCDPAVMSEEYWKKWNPEVQAEIESDIEKWRKSDGDFAVPAAPGTEVSVEQLSHEFGFGAHMMRIGRLRTAEVNRRYEENFLKIFNLGVLHVQWRIFEPYAGDCHFYTRLSDLNSAFVSGERDRMDERTRFLASPSHSTDQQLAFLKDNGMKIHVHTLAWGNVGWFIPYWVYQQYCPDDEKAFLRFPVLKESEQVRSHCPKWWQDALKARLSWLYNNFTEEEIAAKCPVYISTMQRLMDERIEKIMRYIGPRADTYDVINESSSDWARSTGRQCESGLKATKSWYTLLPPDYALAAFRAAVKYVQPHQRLCINDYNGVGSEYTDQVGDLIAHGAKVDIIGWQFHAFQDSQFRDMVAGKSFNGHSDPADIKARFASFEKHGIPARLSEITIPAPGNTPETLRQQAILTWNLYRMWFSRPNCESITWWHSIDREPDGTGESSSSGLMTSDGNPKPSFHALDELINRRWRTRLTVKTELGEDGSSVKFRGFRGRYRLRWRNENGLMCERYVKLTGDVCRESGEERAFVAKHAQAWALPVADVDAPKGEPVSEVTVSWADRALGASTLPAGASKRIALAKGETFFDIAAATGSKLAVGESGALKPAVRLAFDKVVDRDGIANIYWQNDYFGRIYVNGKLAHHGLNGPEPGTKKWGVRPVMLKKGKNEIVFETRHGMAGGWKLALSVEGP